MTILKDLFGLRGSRKYELRQRAAAGARRLDVIRPDWHTRVNVATLDQFEASCCVLGQVYEGEGVIAGFMTGLDAVGYDCRNDYGFVINDCTDEDVAKEFAVLTKAFKKEIANRKAAQ